MVLVVPQQNVQSGFEKENLPFDKERFLRIIAVLGSRETRKMEKSMYAQIYKYVESGGLVEVCLEDLLRKAFTKEWIQDKDGDLYIFANSVADNVYTARIQNFIGQVVDALHGIASCDDDKLLVIGLGTGKQVVDVLRSSTPFVSIDDVIEGINGYLFSFGVHDQGDHATSVMDLEGQVLQAQIEAFIVARQLPLHEFMKKINYNIFPRWAGYLWSAVKSGYAKLGYEELVFFNFVPFTLFKKEGKRGLIDDDEGMILITGVDGYVIDVESDPHLLILFVDEVGEKRSVYEVFI